jgi:hypothetical protein
MYFDVIREFDVDSKSLRYEISQGDIIPFFPKGDEKPITLKLLYMW